MTALQCFQESSRVSVEKEDGETRNRWVVVRQFDILSCSHSTTRQRLVGIAALTGVVTSDALYHSASEFAKQVSILIPGLLLTLYEADLDMVKVEYVHYPSCLAEPFLMFFPSERRS